METSPWKPSAGFGPSFLETGWLARQFPRNTRAFGITQRWMLSQFLGNRLAGSRLAQEVRFPTLSSLLYVVPRGAVVLVRWWECEGWSYGAGELSYALWDPRWRPRRPMDGPDGLGARDARWSPRCG